MPRGGRNNRGDRRRQVAAPRDHERRRRREDGNDRAWNQVLATTSGLRRTALGAIAVLLVLVPKVYTRIGFTLESPAAVWAAYAGSIGILSFVGATFFVPRDAMGGGLVLDLVMIGLVFFYFVTLISLVCVSLTHL